MGTGHTEATVYRYIAWRLFNGEDALPYYRILFVDTVFIGAVTGMELVWNIFDTFL